MHYVKSIRKGLGLTQQALADVIGTSRSVIAMAERGYRKVPTRVIIRLSELVSESQGIGMQTPAFEMPVVVDQPIAEELGKRLERQQELLTMAKSKLSQIQESHNASVHAMQVIARERHLFQGVETYMRKLDKQEERAHTIYKRTHSSAQLTLRLRIIELEAVVNGLRTAIDEVNAGAMAA